MTSEIVVTMGLPHLDIHTLSEDWALAVALERIWLLLADSLGQKPSDWKDAQGERMYGAVMAAETWFDLDDPVREDDVVTVAAELAAIRKPHALGVVRFVMDGKVKAEVRLLTSFIKRQQKGSNKKFSKVRDIWQAEDVNGAAVDAALDAHHAAKTLAVGGAVAMDHEVSRISDFNTADFLYFKNFIRTAKAAEWRENRGRPVRLNAARMAWYFGNVEDGEVMRALVDRQGDQAVTVLQDVDGRRLFLSQITAPVVTIAER
jgi:probable biosynthetic protein (TIGR04098 family)